MQDAESARTAWVKENNLFESQVQTFLFFFKKLCRFPGKTFPSPLRLQNSDSLGFRVSIWGISSLRTHHLETTILNLQVQNSEGT